MNVEHQCFSTNLGFRYLQVQFEICLQVNLMRQEVSDLEKSLENRHTDVTDRDLVLSLDQMDTSKPVTMHGYLFKRTTNAFKTWNRRYFTLQNNQLVYRKRSGKAERYWILDH